MNGSTTPDSRVAEEQNSPVDLGEPCLDCPRKRLLVDVQDLLSAGVLPGPDIKHGFKAARKLAERLDAIPCAHDVRKCISAQRACQLVTEAITKSNHGGTSDGASQHVGAADPGVRSDG